MLGISKSTTFGLGPAAFGNVFVDPSLYQRVDPEGIVALSTKSRVEKVVATSIGSQASVVRRNDPYQAIAVGVSKEKNSEMTWEILIPSLVDVQRKFLQDADLVEIYTKIWDVIEDCSGEMPEFDLQMLMRGMYSAIGKLSLSKNSCELTDDESKRLTDLVVKINNTSIQWSQTTQNPREWMHVFGFGMQCLTVTSLKTPQGVNSCFEKWQTSVVALAEKHHEVLTPVFVLSRLKLREISSHNMIYILNTFHGLLRKAIGHKENGASIAYFETLQQEVVTGVEKIWRDLNLKSPRNRCVAQLSRK